MAKKMTSTVLSWTPLLEEAWKAKGVDPAIGVPVSLAMIAHESGGNPAARNAKENAIGLGQQWSYVGQEKYAPASPPWTHPQGKLGGYRISWDPRDQTKAIAGIMADHMKARTNGHMPSAWLAYASGGGTMAKFVNGEIDQPRASYVAELAEVFPAYSSWYNGWVAAGRPQGTAAVVSGEGTTYMVPLAKTDVPEAAPSESPFDGKWYWKGKSRSDGAAAGVVAAAASAGKGLVAIGAVLAVGFLGYKLVSGGK